MSHFRLNDLPLSVLQFIFAFLLFDGAGVNDVWSFATSCRMFYQLWTGIPALCLTFRPRRLLLRFPGPTVKSFRNTHDIFVDRCVNILDGLTKRRLHYLNIPWQAWFDQHEPQLGLKGVAELLFRLLRFDFVELLVADIPPTIDQLMTLYEKTSSEMFFATYLVFVDYNSSILSYCGTALDQRNGFKARETHYKNLLLNKMPKFIRKLVRDEDDFKIILILPILRAYLHDQDNIYVGDVRVPIMLIETVMMAWLRTLKRDSKWEKYMRYGPWTKEQMDFVRSNIGLSTKLEYPMTTVWTEAMREEKISGKREWRKSAAGKASKKKFNQSAAGKAWSKEYQQSAARKASKKKYRQSAAGKASAKKSNQSAASKASKKKYHQSAASKTSRKKYDQSIAGKARQKKYNRSAANRASSKKWRRSAAGKAWTKEYNARRSSAAGKPVKKSKK